jgi:hypothetical protein
MFASELYTGEDLYESDEGILWLNKLVDNAGVCLKTLAEPVVLETVFWVNTKKYEAIGICSRLYRESAVVRAVFDIVNAIWTWISIGLSWLYSHVMYSRHEPEGEWIHFATLSKSSPRVSRYLEIYEPLDERDIAHRIGETMDARRELSEILAIVRTSTADIVRTVFRGGEAPIPEIPLSVDGMQSEVEFICISYHHPRMNEQSIQLTIPKSMMVVGNHLLSPAFVLRMLEYMPLYVRFHFDDMYSVHVMDNTFTQYVLTSNQYVVVEKDALRVVSR